MSKVTVTCVHCGQSFQIQGAQTDFNEYEKAEQHSPGCGKTTSPHSSIGRATDL